MLILFNSILYRYRDEQFKIAQQFHDYCQAGAVVEEQAQVLQHKITKKHDLLQSLQGQDHRHTAVVPQLPRKKGKKDGKSHHPQNAEETPAARPKLRKKPSLEADQR